MRLDTPPPRRRLIRLTPLIDVVFILLVFFMLASSFSHWRALALNAPARAAGGGGMDGAWLLRVHADGLDLNARPLDLDSLLLRLRERLHQRPEQKLLVQPLEGVNVQALVDVLDRVRDAGVADLTLLRGPREAP